MKKILIVSLSIIFALSFFNCDKENLITDPKKSDNSKYFDYYPLDIGNYWEYGNEIESFFSVEVINDTFIQNKKYNVLREIYFSGNQDTVFRFERLDSSTSCILAYDSYYNTEFQYDSLAALSGQMYEGCRFLSHEEWVPKKVFCMSIDTVTIFNESFERKYLQHSGGQDLPSYSLVKGLGLTNTYFFRSGGYILRYANIKGKIYN